MLLAGGAPLRHVGQIIGALGVSGGSGEQDLRMCKRRRPSDGTPLGEGSIKMRLKTIAKLFVVSLVILTASPALRDADRAPMMLAVVPVNKKRTRVVIGHSGCASRVRAARRVGTVGIQRTMIGRQG